MIADGPRVLALVGDTAGPTMWRVWQPFAELQRHGILAHWKPITDPELNDPRFQRSLATKFHAVIFPRMSWAAHYQATLQIHAMHQLGLAVILEADDDMFSPGIVERQYTVFDDGRQKGLERLERERQSYVWMLRQADGVTVSTRRLKTVVRQFTDVPIEVVPNMIDLAWFRLVLRGATRLVPPLTVGWAGGARAEADLAPVAEAWSRLAVRFPDLTFVVQGHIPDILAAAVPADRCRRLPWAALEEYPRALVNIDIACASVAPTLFNTAKTPIKLWEYTTAGAAVVATPTLYGPYVTDGEDGLLAETADEWESALARLVEDAGLRTRLRRTQRQRIARDHSLAHNWSRWPAAWTAILERFHARHLTNAG